MRALTAAALSLGLAAVYVPANDTAIQSDQITDKRLFVPDLVHIEDRTSAPSAPATGMTLFSMERAGRRFLNTIGAEGLVAPLQPALFADGIRLYTDASANNLECSRFYLESDY